ncbi:MAG TPA: phosphoglycerol geranylgeranyltransferase [Bacteroidales bacterium]|jgi:phosphoglycerol geranylgeranyltransferase|nr:phosphoglycerol geranylgeranyltransferase [Bacteroidales bacterium]MDI9552157.1 phosphoglycerol geranylgeranyltransferase [Bacteroidota bacterium]NLK54219.1 phosphoglycerol geranylgeranyltransferase [Bacteroidales bacterium]HNY53133.1 phosphoglycerol geranylgeranyltransferase [Bacteroidales bacterium]HOG57676.1 phosphoglycerol geranylgeranyltransferase [Bacteroidales bacterium]
MTKDDFPGKRSIALLLDPDKTGENNLKKILQIASGSGTDYILVGGSLTFNSTDLLIAKIKDLCSIPVVLFPGNLLQLSLKADAILLLSLISGRNPELLIGNHVIAAPFLRDAREKLISVGYILVGCGKKTSVEYISQTEAIPRDKTDLVVATALAGEMLGLSMIYLEAGSGAQEPVPPGIIKAVRENVTVPLAVGGGITTRVEIARAFSSGANLIILGNGCEKNPLLLEEACAERDSARQSI